MVTVSDLFDHIGSKEPRPILLCPRCGGEYSANKGDYWNHPQDYTFQCCDEPMLLVHKHTVYEEMKGNE